MTKLEPETAPMQWTLPSAILAEMITETCSCNALVNVSRFLFLVDFLAAVIFSVVTRFRLYIALHCLDSDSSARPRPPSSTAPAAAPQRASNFVLGG